MFAFWDGGHVALTPRPPDRNRHAAGEGGVNADGPFGPGVLDGVDRHADYCAVFAADLAGLAAGSKVRDPHSRQFSLRRILLETTDV